MTATCVDVPVGTGAETYCATDAGPLARWDTAAVDVELERAPGPSADPAAVRRTRRLSRPAASGR